MTIDANNYVYKNKSGNYSIQRRENKKMIVNFYNDLRVVATYFDGSPSKQRFMKESEIEEVRQLNKKTETSSDFSDELQLLNEECSRKLTTSRECYRSDI